MTAPAIEEKAFSGLRWRECSISQTETNISLTDSIKARFLRYC